jgi:hypothetical protein
LQRPEFALSVLEPYMSGYSGVSAPQEGQSEEEGADNYAGSRLASLSRSDRPIVAKEVGMAYLQLERRQDALEYLRLSLRTNPDAARKKDTVQKIEQVKADIRREQANATRRPLLREEVEPGVVVRPRLVARAAPAPPAGKPATTRRPQ